MPNVLGCTVLQLKGPGFVLAPHVYPPSITRQAQETPEESSRRWDLSWGLKMQGLDSTSQVTLNAALSILVAAGRGLALHYFPKVLA